MWQAPQRSAPGLLLLCALSLAGCREEPAVAPPDEPCVEASAQLQTTACVHAIPDAEAWLAVAVSGGLAEQVRATKYLVPARSGARLPTLFLDAHSFQLHFDLLSQAFGDRFGALSPAEYLDLILPAEDREFHAGHVTEYLAEGETVFGFTLWDDPSDPAGAISQSQLEQVHAALSPRFGLGSLHFVPSSSRQSVHAAGWQTDVPIWDTPPSVDYESYTVATGYGTLRLLRPADLAEAVASASFGFRDLLVLQDAPVDIERVIAGAVTGSRQGELSHLNVRSAARGTPNCYLFGALTELAGWEGQLVRLTCAPDELVVESTSLEEAELFWAALRPDPVDVPPPELQPASAVSLLDLPTADAGERAMSAATFGAKGTSLASIYQRIEPSLRFDGLVLPFHHWDA